MKPEFHSADLTCLYNQLNAMGIAIWIDGGWAVDALIGVQTRPHDDVDIVIQQKDVSALRQFLEQHGYGDIPRDDTCSWNFVLGDRKGRQIDVHVITFDAFGNGLYGPPEKDGMYPSGSLNGIGIVDGCQVNCVSAIHLVKFHTGYALREKDYKDVPALCERFGIDYPKEYLHLKPGIGMPKP